MTTLLPDTSAVIAALRGHHAAAEALAHADRLGLSPVVEAELRAGLLEPAVRPSDREATLAFFEGPRIESLTITGTTAVRWAAIRHDLRRDGRMLPINDVWIAASAMEHGLPVLTLDRHFLEIRQILVEFVPAA